MGLLVGVWVGVILGSGQIFRIEVGVLVGKGVRVGFLVGVCVGVILGSGQMLSTGVGVLEGNGVLVGEGVEGGMWVVSTVGAPVRVCMRVKVGTRVGVGPETGEVMGCDS